MTTYARPATISTEFLVECSDCCLLLPYAKEEAHTKWHKQMMEVGGPAGLTGAQGPVGPRGYIGPTGPVGPPGPDVLETYLTKCSTCYASILPEDAAAHAAWHDYMDDQLEDISESMLEEDPDSPPPPAPKELTSMLDRLMRGSSYAPVEYKRRTSV